MDTQCFELFGKVISIIHQGRNSQPSLYRVQWIAKNKDYLVKCFHIVPVRESDSIYAICTLQDDPTFGEYLNVERQPFFRLPTDRLSITEYFVQGFGEMKFGKEKANRLYDLFKTQADDRILEFADTPASLEEQIVIIICELSNYWSLTHDEDLLIPFKNIYDSDRMKKFLFWWHKNYILRRLSLFGLTDREIIMCKCPPEVVYQKCLSNPYGLVPLSLDKCDEILLSQNKVGSPDDKRCGMIIRKLHEMMESHSWTGIPSSVALSIYPDLPKYLPRLKSDDFNLKAELYTLYLPYPYTAETTVANFIINLIKTNKSKKVLGQISFNNSSLSAEQQEAISGALNNNICVITGPAGSGKSVVISEISHNLELQGISYCIGAPTGKAAARLREIMKRKIAHTLHRLVAMKNGIPKFVHLIIDEVTMVNLEIMYEVIQAFPFPFRLTLVGDVNQLQPIGWGTPFEQLIKSGRVPVYSLTKNHRVANVEGAPNGIMINAHQLVSLDNNADEPFEFAETDNFQIINGDINTVHEIASSLLSIGIDAEQVTVLTPYNRDIEEINRLMQEIFNGGSKSILDPIGKLWSKGDRVMLIENNYNINVFNGEEGKIVDVGSNEIGVMFADGVVHPFKLISDKNDKDEDEKTDKKGKKGKEIKEEKELFINQLVHSYSLSIHKCVSENTRIFLEDRIVKIRDLHLGNKPLMPSDFKIHGHHGISRCTQVYKGDIEPSIRVITSLGYHLEGSTRHPILILNAQGQEEWKLLPQLKIGDKVVIRSGMQGNKIQGETNITGKKRSILLRNHKLTSEIWDASSDEQRQLISEIFADGNSVLLFEQMADDLQILLLRHGMWSRREEENKKWRLTLLPSWVDNPKVNMTSSSTVDNQNVSTSNGVSNDATPNGVSNDIIPNRMSNVIYDSIQKIEVAACQMYDLYVEDDSHSFITNGLISHNSQGSEWPIIIIYLPSGIGNNSSFLTRNLIYTAITRAKNAIWIVGEVNALQTAVYRNPPLRHENLALRLQNALPPLDATEKKIIHLTKEIQSPMIEKIIDD